MARVRLLPNAFLIAAELDRTLCLYLALVLAIDGPFVIADRKLLNAVAGTSVGEQVGQIDDWA